MESPKLLPRRHECYAAAKATGETSPDAGEHLQSLVLSAADVAAAVRDGRIRNPYTVVALSRVLDLRA